MVQGGSGRLLGMWWLSWENREAQVKDRKQSIYRRGTGSGF
jgi:hypothetical protein